jgi:hypothetical protein
MGHYATGGTTMMMVPKNQTGFFEVEVWIADRWYKAVLRTYDQPNYNVDPLGFIRYERWMLDILVPCYSPRMAYLICDAIDMWLVEQGDKTRIRIVDPVLRKRIEEEQAQLQEDGINRQIISDDGVGEIVVVQEAGRQTHMEPYCQCYRVELLGYHGVPLEWYIEKVS